MALCLSTSGNKPQLTTFGESLQQAANYQQPADTWKSGIYTSEIHAPNDVIPNHAVLSVLTVGMISRRLNPNGPHDPVDDSQRKRLFHQKEGENSLQKWK